MPRSLSWSPEATHTIQRLKEPSRPLLSLNHDPHINSLSMLMLLQQAWVLSSPSSRGIEPISIHVLTSPRNSPMQCTIMTPETESFERSNWLSCMSICLSVSESQRILTTTVLFFLFFIYMIFSVLQKKEFI